MAESIHKAQEVDHLHRLLLAFDSRDKAIRPGLERIQALCEALGHPQKSFPAVHVAGTNGKGSVVNFVGQALMANGLRVGVYTSPHLHRWTERIAVGGTEIPLKIFIALVETLFDVAKSVQATVFELVTAVAFAHFSQSRVDVAVVEVGLGGRFDATNVVNATMTILTSVGVDHTNFLGSDVRKIAWEKAGIAQSNTPMVCSVLEPELHAVVKAECDAIGAPLHVAQPLKSIEAGRDSQSFDSPWGPLKVSAMGLYQAHNLGVAVHALDLLAPTFSLDQTVSKAAVESATWPGRFEIIGQNPYWLLDGAHNLSGAQALRHTLQTIIAPRASNGKRWLLFAVRADKQYEAISTCLFSWFDRIVLTDLPGSAGLDPSLLHEYAQSQDPDAQSFEQINDALAYVQRYSSGSDLVCVAGSLVLVGEVRWRLLTELP